MKKLIFLSTVTGICSFFALLLGNSHHTPWTDVGAIVFSAGLLLLGVINLFSPIVLWRHYRLKSFIPFFIVLGFVVFWPTATNWGKDIRIYLFKQKLPEYKEVVALVQNGTIPLSSKAASIELPEQYQHLAYSVFADWEPGEILTVEFLTGGRFPLKHSGYLYRSDDRPGSWKGLQRWPGIKKIIVNWYSIND